MLAVRSGAKHEQAEQSEAEFTPGQARALADLARSLVQAAKQAGAEKNRVTVGNVSFELEANGKEEVLSIRATTGSVADGLT